MEKYPGYSRKPFYYETDKMGIIHHSNYIRWFEEARVDALNFMNCPFEKIEADGIMIPVLGVSCEYKEMVRFGDEVLIQPVVKKYTGTRLDFEYRVYNGEKLVTTGTSQHCFMSYETNRLVQLRKTHPALHELFLDYYETTKEECSSRLIMKSLRRMLKKSCRQLPAAIFSLSIYTETLSPAVSSVLATSSSTNFLS